MSTESDRATPASASAARVVRRSPRNIGSIFAKAMPETTRIRERLVAALKVAHLDEPLRRFYYRRNPPAWYAARQFYRRLIRPGMLVFDVGANVGEKVATFRGLGARVLAIEPVPEALDRLRTQFGADSMVVIVPMAVGDEVGSASIRLGDNSTTSSLSDAWITRIAAAPRMANRHWVGEATVPITTLDTLISEHGAPDYCKIDTEGYDDHVLGGLSRALPLISFEFMPECLDVAIRCVERLTSLGCYEFNYSFHAPMRLELQRWTPPERLLTTLPTLAAASDRPRWGDIFARRVR